MRVRNRQNVMKDLTVKEAMRRLIINLPQEASLEQAISYAIKYKVNAILITDPSQEALGVVTKTDLMGAYYAGLPLATPASAIMVGPPLFCHLDDSLDAALDQMRTQKIHRLYVREEAPTGRGRPGLSGYRGFTLPLLPPVRTKPAAENRMTRSAFWPTGSSLREVMTPGVFARGADDSLLQVMEGLAAHKFGALLITGAEGRRWG